jgi:hypothetical protein
MSEIDRFARWGDPDRLDPVAGDADRATILEAAEAIDRYVAAVYVALGLLQLMALAELADSDVALSSFS